MCGDGVVDPGEACDAGEANDNAGACTQSCQPATCGDGFVHADHEDCEPDPADAGTGPCTPECKHATCGDGYVEAGVEECDAGLAENSDTGACTMGCKRARCGDGLVHTGVEQCDLGDAGNDDSYGGCLPDTCQLGPRCGDGTLQVEHGEECDLGPDNGVTGPDGVPCSNECMVNARLVFVTSEKFDAALGGLDGADLACQNAAENAGLARSWSFRAWLSDGGPAPNNPASRFAHGPEFAGVPYVLRNGERVADDWDDLVKNGPKRPIDVTEDNMQLDPVWWAWTNTTHTGATYDETHHCNGWKSNDPILPMVLVGTVVPTVDQLDIWKDDRHWTSAEEKASCGDKLRLYCFEQDLL